MPTNTNSNGGGGFDFMQAIQQQRGKVPRVGAGALAPPPYNVGQGVPTAPNFGAAAGGMAAAGQTYAQNASAAGQAAATGATAPAATPSTGNNNALLGAGLGAIGPVLGIAGGIKQLVDANKLARKPAGDNVPVALRQEMADRQQGISSGMAPGQREVFAQLARAQATSASAAGQFGKTNSDVLRQVMASDATSQQQRTMEAEKAAQFIQQQKENQRTDMKEVARYQEMRRQEQARAVAAQRGAGMQNIFKSTMNLGLLGVSALNPALAPALGLLSGALPQGRTYEANNTSALMGGGY